MQVLVVNGERYLVNVSVCDTAVEQACNRILSAYPDDAVVDWDENVTLEDVL